MAKKHIRLKEPYIVTLDEVRITRDGETGIVEYLEENVVTTNYTIGPGITKMTDQDILDMHNQSIRAQNESAVEFQGEPLVEIPLGSPQIEYHKESDQWCARGDVLRCVIEEDVEEDCRLPTIVIDDLELTLEEFGRMLLVRAGFGMRIAFVEEEDIHRPVKIEVREPEDDQP